MIKRYIDEGGNPYEGLEGDDGSVLQWIYMGVCDDEVGLRAELVRGKDGWRGHGVEWHVRQPHGVDDQVHHVCGMFGNDNCYISMMAPNSKGRSSMEGQMGELHILGERLVQIYEGINETVHEALEKHWEKWR